jgi:ion channel-forming bestrophin family protein
MKLVPRLKFWDHVFSWEDPGARPVTRQVLYFTGYSALVQLVNEYTNRYHEHWGDWGLEVAPYEVAGAALSALLVLRTNAGYERWWEARKLWGSITNQSRNLAILMLANGPDDPGWRRKVVGWIAAFGHVTRHSLRAEPDTSELVSLVGKEEAARIARADHMPMAVSMRIASLLREARDREVFDRLAFNRAEEQRCLLVDHMGGCERILRTPLAAAYVVLIRRFIVLFLLVLPWALMPRVGWFTPLFMLLITYPILALDRIGDDLQHPFSVPCINHLPLDDITANIERNLLALLDEPREGEGSGLHLTGTASGG